MSGKEKGNPMWGELQEFVKQVEREQNQTGDAKPYIDQIKTIIARNMLNTSNIETD